MLWCPECKVEREGPGKFCTDCGKKLIEPQLNVVLCNGKLEDGSICNAEVKPDSKFCQECGTKIDRDLFRKHANVCQKCKTDLPPRSAFCANCGEKVASKDKVNKENQVDKVLKKQDVHTTVDQQDQHIGLIWNERTSWTEGGSLEYSEKKLDKPQSDDIDMSEGEAVIPDPHLGTSPDPGTGFETAGMLVCDQTTAEPDFSLDVKSDDIASVVSLPKSNEQQNVEVMDYETERAENTKPFVTKLSNTDINIKHVDEDKPNRLSTEDASGTGPKIESNQTKANTSQIEEHLKNEHSLEFNSNDANLTEVAELNKGKTKVDENAKGYKHSNADQSEREDVGAADSHKEPHSKVKSPSQDIRYPSHDVDKGTSPGTYTDPENKTDRPDRHISDSQVKTTEQQATKKVNLQTVEERYSGMVTRSQTQQTKSNQTKTDQLDKEKGQKASGTPTGQRQTNRPIHQTGEKMMHVCFHALLSEDCNIDIERDKVILRSDKLNFGGWDSCEHVLKFTSFREKLGNYVEVRYECDIPHSLALSGFQYKYCILKHKEGKYLYEPYWKDGRNDEKTNRIFYLTDQQKKSVPDRYYRFDGVIHSGSKSLIGWLADKWNRTKKLKGDCEQYVQYFTTKFIKFDNHGSLRENVDLCYYLMLQLRNHYQIDANCWSYEYEFKNEVGSKLLKNLVQSFKTRQQKITTEETVIAALSFVMIMKYCDLYKAELSDEDQHNICKALLVHPLTDRKTCMELAFIDQHYPKYRPSFRDAVIRFMQYVGSDKGKDPSWMLVLPLAHFLTDMSSPFQFPNIEVRHDDVQPFWWGIAGPSQWENDQRIRETCEDFRGKNKTWQLPLHELVDLLEPLFRVDYLLPRSFMATLNLAEIPEVIELGKVPMYICVANLNSFLKWAFSQGYGYNQKTVCKCIDLLSNMKETSTIRSLETLIMANLSHNIAADIVKSSLRIRAIDSQSRCVQLFLNALSKYENVRQGLRDENIQELLRYQDPGVYTEKLLPGVLNWLVRECSMWYKDNLLWSLQRWTGMMAPDALPSKSIRDSWNSAVSKELKNRLNSHLQESRGSTSAFIHMYCHHVETFCGCMQEVLSQVATKAVETGYSPDFNRLEESERGKFGRLLSSMFLKQWDKTMATGEDEEKILEIILTWQPFPSFLRILNTLTESNKGEGCTEGLVKAMSVIELRINMLLSGTTTVTGLKELQKYADKFATVVSLINSKDVTDETTVKLIKLRSKEVEHVQKKAELVTKLTSICHVLKEVDISELNKMLLKMANIGEYRLDEFCKPLDIKTVKEVDQCDPIITAFNLPVAVEQILTPLSDAYMSSVFLKLWEDQCTQQGKECSSLEDIVKIIWEPVNERWREIIKQVETGDITFNEMERHLGMTYRDNYDTMMNELITMNITEQISKDRIRQLQQYRQLETSVKGAKDILQLATLYSLNGDFKQIRNIASHEDVQIKMKSFDESMMDTCKILKDITTERSECLAALVKADPLVKWLKESIKTDGLKELKVFVDLALISAGEQTLDIDRVQALNTAVLGYSPLIFDLKTELDYKGLLEKCDRVWKELETNKNLPHKLLDSCRHLEWLKAIQKAHGSVEVRSLAQAEAINSSGVYTVGYMKENIFLNPTNVLSLRVTSIETGKTERRTYTYDHLQDLQSRLMLVAGRAEKDKTQGKDEVETFTEVFDGVKRLANVYIKLHDAGCVLFKTWKASFICDSERPVCALLEFGQGVEKLKGRRTKTEDTGVIIRRVAKFLESCLEAWLKYISIKRNTYLHLNYFTIDQLVQLQRELVKIGTNEEPSLMIYPLLSAVKQDCTPSDLQESVHQAQQKLDEIDLEMSKKETEAKEEVVNPEEDMRQTFIVEMAACGFNIILATKALEIFKPDQIDEGMAWCIEHDGEFDNDSMTEELHEIIASESTTKKRHLIPNWAQSDRSVLSIASTYVGQLVANQKEFGVEPLIKGLGDLWDTFLGSISSNLNDYVSLDHLGLILKNLSQGCHAEIKRTFLASFRNGVPNLVIVPTEEVIKTVLTIYMKDDDQPLPQADEVLVCNIDTSLDEVDIFWRRAIFDGGRKIHCLVNADLLDFDVSDRAEKLLEGYVEELNHTAPDFRLVVICGSENEYRSKIAAALDKYKRPTLLISSRDISHYLLERFQMTQNVDGRILASGVDFTKSCVRVIKSWRAGVGKSLYIQRRVEHLEEIRKEQEQRHQTDDRSTRPSPEEPVDEAEYVYVKIPLQEKKIDVDAFSNILLRHTTIPGSTVPRIFHIDISHEVQDGVDFLLFNLLVLRCLTNKIGNVWRCSVFDMYLVENMPIIQAATDKAGEKIYIHSILSILPSMTCHSPCQSLAVLSGETVEGYQENDQLFDEKMSKEAVFQRPFQYLSRLDRTRAMEETKKECLSILLRHCGTPDPSWSELHNFVSFLNTQLESYENNDFILGAGEDLPGFDQFALKFLIQMSRDFSSRSLNMSEETPTVAVQHVSDYIDKKKSGDDNKDLEPFQMRRTWESSPHPYLFFNADRMSFTFLGFNIDRANRNLTDHQTRQVLEKNIMTVILYDVLLRNDIPIQEDFDGLERDKKIAKLCNVMGVKQPVDPDRTYELTTDNVKKIMAIYMRFRCDIPVIIMGETGCGKTRLVKFMCALQMPSDNDSTNMILVKVHGGTTKTEIIRKVNEAEQLAKRNKDEIGDHVYTVLFFDEANTTECIGLIKEIMCDKTMEGEKLQLCKNLKFVAACNPYRKHSDDFIKRLEQAGLGYHVDADKTTDRLGRVPMRRLVYRVQPLPQSMLPLVWDFGQLNTEVEDLYIRQMVRRYIREGELPDIPGLVEIVSVVLTASQDFMRNQEDECSFVSLRDADRVLSVMSWFYRQSLGSGTLFNQMNTFQTHTSEDQQALTDLTRSLIQALGVCYHACLKNRDKYRDHIAKLFKQPCELPGGADQMHQEIVCCQDVFLSNVHLEKNIARNMALKENVFMMVVCIELRIPLFLVGKPGSSKSLAKTIVSDAMQGNAAHEQLFKELKQVQMVSFQCSPLSIPDGIVGTFRQCAKFQDGKNLDKFVSIVVLDEVGLAEDSPRMPLKTLHPLLEDGCQGDETPEPYMKVAFIGISNWALDPAKMNRGILVQREVPDIEELKNSAEGICAGEPIVTRFMKPLIEPLARSYLAIFEEVSVRREFFGLRDFYSLVKMVFSFVEKSKKHPTWFELQHAIRRNFGGLDDVDPVQQFMNRLSGLISFSTPSRIGDPECTPAALIEACLFDTYRTYSDSRYLLLLTENYGALTILQQQIFSKRSEIRPITIFGSSFPSDQEYTQVCRNINKIKVCMETGNTVVLLNLENIYESLYDALNQYYVYFGGERYVDLGLGTHRVKCRVHKQFRLIVVAEKQAVYENFPIPLINRLEKHFLTTNTMLTSEQQAMVEELREWSLDFVKQKKTTNLEEVCSVEDAFMGYHEDTCSALVLHVWRDVDDGDKNAVLKQILIKAKKLLLWCATPDVVIKTRKSHLPLEEQNLSLSCYFKEQAHDSLSSYLRYQLKVEWKRELFAQITTHSKLLATSDRAEIADATDIKVSNIILETLQSFDTEQQFSNKIKTHLLTSESEATLLIIQCDSGNINGPLIASARYCVMDECQKVHRSMRLSFHVVFIIQLPRIAGGCFTGFQCGIWHSAHIDDLRPFEEGSPTIDQMEAKSPGTLFQDAVNNPAVLQATEVSDSGSQPISAEPMQSGTSIKINAIILSSLQPALSMVKDRKEDVGRTTKRVAHVLELLRTSGEQGSPTFFAGICRLIALLLQEKEKSGHGYGSEHWLAEEAVKIDTIQKAGTFRRACLQVLESKIAPFLGGIIAYLDTNHNLDLLKQTQSPWKIKLWLDILNSPDALQLRYDNFQSPTKKSDLQEVIVMTTGCEGHMFSEQMPFSWLIYRQLEKILRTPQPGSSDYTANETETKMNLFERVFRESTLGKLLSATDDPETRKSQVLSYLSDYVHFVYNSKSEDEKTFVCESLEYLVSQMTEGSQEQSSLSLSLIYVHQAYQQLVQRLNYFRIINAVWPECSSRMTTLEKSERTDETFTALCLLIKDLEPKRDELNDHKMRSNWLGKINRYHPVVSTVMSLYAEDPNQIHNRNQASINKVKCLWSRVLAVKLFLEHVCSKDAEERSDKITVKRCMPLFVMLGSLGDELDFKQVNALTKVEKFLKLCNGTAVAEFMESREKCCRCEINLEVPPVILPCKDIVCEHCLLEIQDSDEIVCPNCNTAIPPDFDSTMSDRTMSAGIAKMRDYQKRCNGFFMDLVAQLCFSDNTPPNVEVIDKLLGYIVCTIESTKGHAGQKIQLTKELTIFNSSIDPNPVFRSFLLQLLMRTSGNTVKENLKKYLTQAQGLLQSGKLDCEEHYVELCLMVIQCLEDIVQQETDKTNITSEATNRLRLAKASIYSEDLNIDKLYALAFARSGLAGTATCIKKMLSSADGIWNHQESGLIEAAQSLCEEGISKWPKIYLVKYLCRCFGVDAYQAVCESKSTQLQWLKSDDREQVVEGSDWYVIYGGPSYTKIREALTRVLLGEKTDILHEALQPTETYTEIMLTMAIHREITCANLYPESKRRVTENMEKKIMEFCQKREGRQKDLTLAVLQNKLGAYCRMLKVKEGDDLRQQGIQGLLVHFLTVIYHLEDRNTLIQPLIGLTKTPHHYEDSLIPTMPQDDLAETKDYLVQAMRASDNATMYLCPNGHPYIIGNCGMAMVESKCKCGAIIGGASHTLRTDNKKYSGEDTTQTGHILELDDVIGQGAKPERSLSPIQCTCVRLFTHMALYLGAANDPAVLIKLIKPPMEAHSIPEFLNEHLKIDLENLQTVLSRSPDDVYVLIHSVIKDIMTTHEQGEEISIEMSRLTTKAGRQKWEDQFAKTYINPMQQNMEDILKEGHKLIGQDHRLGADPLLSVLYETDTPSETISPNKLQDIPSVWRYRTHISIENLRRELDSKNPKDSKGRSKHAILELFLQEEHILRALRHIPSILKLQRALFQKYQRKLDKAEANTITVEQLQRDEIAGEETSTLVSGFSEAWDLVRTSLDDCPTELGIVTFPKELCRLSITKATPISVLLPTMKESGLCSFAMMDFLLRKQNDVLDRYMKLVNRKPDTFSKVSPMDVTAAHLISYDPAQDILPMVLANSEYSFEIGKGTNIEYDFRGLERQLADRFLYSKSLIEIGLVMQIETMVYRAEFTNVSVFNTFREKIPQERLTAAVRHQIGAEVKSLPDVCQSLGNLDIALSFLKSVGGDPEQYLCGFMSDTLKMDSPLQSQTARQECRFKHAESLWLLFSFLRTKKMADNKQGRQSMFENVSDEFHQSIPEEVRETLDDYLREQSIEKLNVFIEVLHEFILLVVSVKMSQDDGEHEDTTTRELKDWLYGHLEAQDMPPMDAYVALEIPDGILYRHSVDLWVKGYETLNDKLEGRR